MIQAKALKWKREIRQEKGAQHAGKSSQKWWSMSRDLNGVREGTCRQGSQAKETASVKVLLSVCLGLLAVI